MKKVFKKFSTIVLCTLGLFLASSCTDLEFENEAFIVPVGVGNADELLASAYGQLREFANERVIFGLSGHSSDEILGPTRGTDWFDGGVFQQMQRHTWDANHAFIQTSFNDLNLGVFRATQAMVGDGATPQIIAEAKTVRAYFWFHILDFWGITLDRGAEQGIEVNPVVRSSAESVAFLIADLESALPDLPDTSSPNRVNKNSARALLAKLYLNKGVYEADDRSTGSFTFAAADMNKVIEYVNDITASGNYSITAGVEGYYNTFAERNDEQSSELIFSVPRAELVDFKRRWNYTLHYNQKPSGWNGFATLSDFYDSFEDDDIRKGAEYNSETNPYTSSTGTRAGFLIGQQLDEAGNSLTTRGGDPLAFSRDVDFAVNTEEKGIRVLKYIPDFSGGVDNADDPNNSYVLLRYGDALLNKAEAIHRGGTDPNGQTATDIIDEIRVARGLAAGSLALSDDTLLAERGRELYWEGWRRNDLVRFGKFLDEWQQKPASGPERILFPIPTPALLANPDITQNPGY
jgi:hypothetical protein